MLLYFLEQGEVEQRIIQQCMQEGLPLPKRIQDAPEVELGLDIFLQAFFELSSSRVVGMDQGPIPWMVIDAYCQRLELEDDMVEDMFYHIRYLDRVYLGFSKTKNKQPTAKKPQPRKRG